MKHLLPFLLAACLLPSGAQVRVIFDTDMGNDIDDALALALLHALESRGEARLLAVTVTKDNPYAPLFVSVVNTFYGRGEIPVGMVRDGKTREDGKYTRQTVEMKDASGKPLYARAMASDRAAPEAVALLRQTLAAQPDQSVVLVQVGFSTNLLRLLDSPPDPASPLGGRDLIRKKVRFLSVMAGLFPPAWAEYNVKIDIPSAQKLFSEWPGPIVCSGFEIGAKLKYPARSIENDFKWTARHPVADAYRFYMKMPYDRETWDLTSVLYAVRPDDGYFQLSAPGTIVVDDAGKTNFEKSPQGRHRHLLLDPAQAPRILEAMTLLASQPHK
jgi:inosine-uridine nucleoside N-ribohydrolase